MWITMSLERLGRKPHAIVSSRSDVCLPNRAMHRPRRRCGLGQMPLDGCPTARPPEVRGPCTWGRPPVGRPTPGTVSNRVAVDGKRDPRPPPAPISPRRWTFDVRPVFVWYSTLDVQCSMFDVRSEEHTS